MYTSGSTAKAIVRENGLSLRYYERHSPGNQHAKKKELDTKELDRSLSIDQHRGKLEILVEKPNFENYRMAFLSPSLFRLDRSRRLLRAVHDEHPSLPLLFFVFLSFSLDNKTEITGQKDSRVFSPSCLAFSHSPEFFQTLLQTTS